MRLDDYNEALVRSSTRYLDYTLANNVIVETCRECGAECRPLAQSKKINCRVELSAA